ncbi:MAG: F0F1 ATP synthase subunit delta [Verrucomicrobiae bacterium]|nr:F0F1 ATP synthase subunit delta [Verrucomicrobiae bacterium]
MKSNRETRHTARKLFRSCMARGQLDEARVRKLVSLVAREKPRGYIAILAEIEKLAWMEQQKRTVVIESAAPIDAGQMEEIQRRIQARLPSSLVITSRVTPSLIGGLRVKVGSDVWDGSVAARLNQLQLAQ